ncbi:hypothetical protein DCO17_03255 [Polynucleobacter tropicus]|uniref:Uncharacterized protein n=1 Tax=Polynucleobacter tropicus TaxID=1743174 RepID=A0A6M9PUJ2_9BURK|nr:hypothetical protein [Polynucleobacter tropicus]QKM64339.1 hypothetical protein DCO17_03255 [Polynucleobacter tropicus]
MSDPQRHDIFEDENGTRVAVRQVFPPNAMGIAYIEYKNLSDSNLRFLPHAEFLEKFKWVDNFGATDTFAKTNAHVAVVAPPHAEEGEEKGSGEAKAASGESDKSAADHAEENQAAKPSRTE